MPLQNRVTPFGEIIADPARGGLMGNRGCLHDEHRQLRRRRWAHQAWVSCALAFKHWQRQVMKPGVYTELFFTDEAVALAAGHRPCGTCRHGDYMAFQRAFGLARPELGERPWPAAMNRLLHADRVHSRSRAQRTHPAGFETLPEEVFFTLPGQSEALVQRGGRIFGWSFGGYVERRVRPSGLVTVLTPRVTVDVIRAGYRVAPARRAAAPLLPCSTACDNTSAQPSRPDPMTDSTLADLGWSPDFQSQLEPDELEATPPARLCDVHRDRVQAMTPLGEITLTLPNNIQAGDLAVGDWVLVDPAENRVVRALERRSVLRRRAAGTVLMHQLIAANVDTLIIVTSCNADFNPARLERYLTLAASSDTQPLIVLTKGDLVDNAGEYVARAEALSPHVSAITLDARDPAALDRLLPWLQPGATAALVGSSGVGKSTILNGLTAENSETQGNRKGDNKGRHTTTSRSLRATHSGAWLIDTPGMRSLGMSDSGDGIDRVFSDLTELATNCKFSDCAHKSEPGCAIQAAIKAGDVDADRFARWEKLLLEDRFNSETPAEARARKRGFTKKVKSSVQGKRGRQNS